MLALTKPAPRSDSVIDVKIAKVILRKGFHEQFN